ncbi:MAG: hypothetical protein ACFFAU_13065 [Candidatus Hodarchaeota archaeon]
MNKDNRGFLSALSWREYFLIGGLLIIWAFAALVGLNALNNENITEAGFAIFLGIVFTGVLLILIAIIDRIF